MHRAGAVETTRGCRYLCRHCPIPPVYSGRLFAVRLEQVLEDVAALVDAGAEHITFADPDFLNAPTHARRVVARLHDRWPSLTFDFTAKVEHLVAHAELMPFFREAGCLFVVSAVESLSDRVLAVLDKGHDRGDVLRALEVAEGAGIALRPTFVPFTPWETLDGYVELLDFLLERELVDHVDPVQLSIRLLVPPGSLLETHPEMTPHLVGLDASSFSWRWRHPDPRMDRLALGVSAMIERSVAEKWASERAFLEARHLAHLALGDAVAARAHDARAVGVRATRARDVPRLTEPWFC